MFNDGVIYNEWKKQNVKIYILKPSFFNLTENTDALVLIFLTVIKMS